MGFIIEIAAIALAGIFICEFLFFRRKTETSDFSSFSRYDRSLYRLAIVVILFSALLSVAAAFNGRGSVAAQVGLVSSSGPIIVLDSLFRGYSVIGIALLFASFLGDICSRKEVFVGLGIAVAGKVMEVYLTAITAPLIELLVFIVFATLLLGIVKFRQAAVLLCLVFIIWPTVFEIRNEIRAEAGVRVDKSVSAFDRLRFDEQIARAQEVTVPLPQNNLGYLQNPNIFEVIRYGVVPRALDSDRDLVSTGRIINVALGHSDTSAFTFLPVTTTYVLQGPLGTFFTYFGLAFAFGIIWKGGSRLSVSRLILVCAMLSGPLGWFATYPDTTIGAIQLLVSGFPVYLVLGYLRNRRKRNAAELNSVTG